MAHDRKYAGLQQHSIGADYPLTVVGLGNGFWRVMDLSGSSWKSEPVRDVEEAHEIMYRLTANRKEKHNG